MPVSRSLLRRLSTPTLVIVTLVIALNPYGISTGELDIDPYLPIRSEIENTNNGKLLLLSSYDDFYSIQSNEILRRETSEAYVERGYEEILSAASLGDEFFSIFLLDKRVTHILVPITTSRRGEIRYRWGERGSIRIQLSEPYFLPIVETAGDFPVALYRVLSNTTSKKPILEDPNYLITWGRGIRAEFYQVIRSVVEKGMYSYEYSKSYENGIDVNWVFSYPRSTDGLPDIPEIIEFKYRSSSPDMAKVDAEITLVAAFGPQAPTQIVRVSKNGEVSTFKISANNPALVNLRLNDGDKVRLTNVLPCRLPETFQTIKKDWRKYCFGISDIQIRLANWP
jgi:hypothetical protein